MTSIDRRSGRGKREQTHYDPISEEQARLAMLGPAITASFANEYQYQSWRQAAVVEGRQELADHLARRLDALTEADYADLAKQLTTLLGGEFNQVGCQNTLRRVIGLPDRPGTMHRD